MKKAYIFPGQGSQFPGMGKELYEIPEAKELLEKANEILGFRITDIMFNGTAEELKATKVTQPAIFLHSVILSKCYFAQHPELKMDMTAGHSLGEFSALAAAGAMKFEDALKLVAIRAEQMQICCEKTEGTMAAIIGLEDNVIEDICNSCNGIIIPANYNCNGQVVISGEKVAIEEACQKAKDAGAKRALILAVSGAFHSPIMEPARTELAKAIEKTEIVQPSCPIYQNVTGEATTDPELIKKNLLLQLTSPVKWTQTIKNMIADGAEYFMEIGPGKVLQGLVKRIGGRGMEIAGLQELPKE